MSEYLSSTCSLPSAWVSASLKRASSVMKASTVCMPLTSESLRSHRYSASRSQPGTVTTDGQKGSRTRLSSPCSFGSSTTMEPRHGSATTSTPSPDTSHPVHTRSTMQLTTSTRPASLACSDSTAAWSFSHANRIGGSACSPSHSGSDESRGSSTPSMAPPSEHEKEVARASSSPSSSRLEPKTRLCGGIASGTPSPAATTSTFCTTTLLLTLIRSWSGFEPPCRKSCCHRALGRWTTANGTPDADTAGTTSPRPSRPAPNASCSGPSAFCKTSSVTSGSSSQSSASHSRCQSSPHSVCTVFCHAHIFCQSSRVRCLLSSFVVGTSNKSSSNASGPLAPSFSTSASYSCTSHSDIWPSSFTWHSSTVRGSGPIELEDVAAIWMSRAGTTGHALLQLPWSDGMPWSDGIVSPATSGKAVGSIIIMPDTTVD
eukprot:scaffold52860_cov64-Phaeocystis_antarctica.AAC.3